MPGKQRTADNRRAESLRNQVADLAARQDRLIEELETTDPADRTFRDRLRRRFDTLETERADKTAQLHDLDSTTRTAPEQAAELLDALPILEDLDITEAPERVQRKLYDALQLTIHYDRPDQARFRLVLTDDTAEALAATSGGTVTDLPTTRAHGDRTPPGAPETSYSILGHVDHGRGSVSLAICWRSSSASRVAQGSRKVAPATWGSSSPAEIKSLSKKHWLASRRTLGSPWA